MSKLESSKSEINTNMSLVEMKGNAVRQLKRLTLEERNFAISEIEKFIVNSGKPSLLMLLSNELRYYTSFKVKNNDLTKAATAIVEFIETEEFFINLGELKLVDDGESHLEIWVGDKFFALFNYDPFIVEI